MRCTPMRTTRANRKRSTTTPALEPQPTPTPWIRGDGRFEGHGQLIWGNLGFDAWLARLHAQRVRPAPSVAPPTSRRHGTRPMFARKRSQAA